MDGARLVRLSKRLSYVLRHDPGSHGLTLDREGWVDVDLLLAALSRHGRPVSRVDLELVVARNDKRRFALDTSRRRIRAQQGHSVPVDLGYLPRTPPPVLYHGTPEPNVPAILRDGLVPGRRHAVHLSPDAATARAVGDRRGPSVVLEVDAARLAADGTELTCSPNGVWLAAAVPPRYVRVRTQAVTDSRTADA